MQTNGKKKVLVHGFAAVSAKVEIAGEISRRRQLVHAANGWLLFSASFSLPPPFHSPSRSFPFLSFFFFFSIAQIKDSYPLEVAQHFIADQFVLAIIEDSEQLFLRSVMHSFCFHSLFIKLKKLL